MVASFPAFSAVGASPNAIDFHASPGERFIGGIEHDLRHPRPVFPTINARGALRKRVIAPIVAGESIWLHRHSQILPALARILRTIEPRRLRPRDDHVGMSGA